MTSTPTKAHSTLGASNCKRWWACPGSVRMCEGIENKSTPFANEGSAAHALGEHCLRNGYRADDFLDCWISMHGTISMSDEGIRDHEKGVTTFHIDEEMAEAVQVYIDFYNAEFEEGDQVEIEQRVDLSQFHPKLFGTADLVIYKPKSKKLIVGDYKHGRGVAVEVTDNVQGLYYAAGAALRLHNRGVAEIEIVIIQPRCGHKDGPVRRWSTTSIELLEWVQDLAEAAVATEDPNAPLSAGDHCKFCPAAAICPALAGAAVEAARADFTESGDVVTSSPATYDSAALAQALQNVDLIESWCRSVKKFAHDEAIAGRTPPGFKLVNTRATRKWKDPEDALSSLNMLEIDESLFMSEPELKSVAQVEKAVGKKLFKSFEALVESRSSGVTLAPLSDKRDPVKPEAAAEFA